jgi:hypothetical protein
MNSVVTPAREAAGAGAVGDVVSPELALVDPILAASARARLAGPRPAPPRTGETRRRPIGVAELSPAFGRNARRAIPDEVVAARASRPHSWRVLVGVAVVTVLGLLFFDVRVQVGRTPADAESTPKAHSDGSPPRDTRQGSASRKQGGTKKRAARSPTARRFAWAPTQGASAYHVELFRRDLRVFAGDTSEPQIEIPARWTLNGHRHELRTGEYRWLVWPVVSGLRASRATVQATLTISG